jgi:hypothetical protein
MGTLKNRMETRTLSHEKRNHVDDLQSLVTDGDREYRDHKTHVGTQAFENRSRVIFRPGSRGSYV